MEKLKNIERPVWNSRGKEWRIDKSAVYLPYMSKVTFTDDYVSTICRGVQEIWW